jgi:hypothetical protein
MDPITIIGFIALVAGGSLFVFSRIPKQTIKNYKDYSGSLEKRLGDLEDSDKDKTRQIATLEGQVSVLKTIPLKEISETLISISRAVAAFTDHLNDHSKQTDAAKDEIIKVIKNYEEK